MRDVCADLRAELREFNGEPDHVHLLVHHPPTVARSRLVNSLKGCRSRRLRAQYAPAGSTGPAPAGACGRRHTSPRPAAGRPSRSSRSTSVDSNDPASRGFLPALKDGVYALEHR